MTTPNTISIDNVQYIRADSVQPKTTGTRAVIVVDREIDLRAEVERLTEQSDKYNVAAGMYCMQLNEAQAELSALRAGSGEAVANALDATGCERIKDYYSVGPVQRAAVESFANALMKVRPVQPLECPQCHALWLFWPKEQSGFDTDTLSVKSAKHCEFCEKANSSQLTPLGNAPHPTTQRGACGDAVGRGFA